MPKNPEELEEVEEGTAIESIAIMLLKALMRSTRIKDIEVYKTHLLERLGSNPQHLLLFHLFWKAGANKL
jgi:hypothetical protein